MMCSSLLSQPTFQRNILPTSPVFNLKSHMIYFLFCMGVKLGLSIIKTKDVWAKDVEEKIWI
jgi:hypothetical protein